MTDNPTFCPEHEREIEPGTFIARSWHDLDLLRHVFSDDLDMASVAVTELERRRLVREALSVRFRERQISEYLREHRRQLLHRRRLSRRLALFAGVAVSSAVLTTALFFSVH